MKYTYLIYDKYAGDHSFNNLITKDISINDVLNNDDYIIYHNKNAIEKYKEIFPTLHLFSNVVNNDLLGDLYDILLCISDICVVTIIKIDNEKLNSIHQLPYHDLFKILCYYHSQYTNNTINISYPDRIKNTFNYVIPFELFDYQKQNLNWMLDIEDSCVRYRSDNTIQFDNLIYCNYINEFYNTIDIKFYGGILCDDFRLGKSVQLLALSLLDNKPTLIVCPNNSSKYWVNLINKYSSSTVNLINSKKSICKINNDAKFTIINNSLLNSDIYNVTWNRVIIDDVHFLNNNNYNLIKSKYRWCVASKPTKELFYFISNSNKIFEKHVENNSKFMNYITDNYCSKLSLDDINIKKPNINNIDYDVEYTEDEKVSINMLSKYLIKNKHKLRDEILDKFKMGYGIEELCEKYNLSYKTSDIINKNIVSKINYIDNLKKHIDKDNDEFMSPKKKLFVTNEFEQNNKQLPYYKQISDMINKNVDIECSICLDMCSKKNIAITKCNHLFCYTCIYDITNSNYNNCPICRKILQTNDIYMLINNDMKIVSKMNKVIDLIKNNDNSIIIVSSHNDTINNLQNELNNNNIPNTLYTSKNNKLNNIVLYSIDYSLLGVDLTNYNKIIFLDKIKQSKNIEDTEKYLVSRLYEIGNEKKIDVIKVFLNNSKLSKVI